MTKSAKKASFKKQTKITDKWFSKDSKGIHTIPKRNISQESKSVATRQSLKRKASTSIESLEKENNCDDNEIIERSPDLNKSGLRKKIQKTVQARARTPKLTPQKEYSPIKVNADRKDTEPESDFSSNESHNDALETEKNRENKKNTSRTTKKNKKSYSKDSKTEIPIGLLKKVYNLKVQLQHEVPPQHSLGDDLTFRSMNKEQTLAFEAYGPLKKGLYSENEDKIIKRNWEHFCKIHNWNPKIVKPFVNLKHTNNTIFYIASKSERKHFVQFLANGLPWRSLCSVYLRFKNLYSTDFNSGKFSAEDDQFILTFIAKASNNNIKHYIAELANKMNRKRMSVWHRYQVLKKKFGLKDFKVNEESIKNNSRNKNNIKNNSRNTNNINNNSRNLNRNVKWSYPVVKKFLDTLLKVTNSNNIKSFKNRELNKKIWERIENETNISTTVLQNFWYLQLHMQLFCTKPIYLNDFKIKLIEYLYKKGIQKLEDINWKNICKHFDGTTTLFLSSVFDTLVIYAQDKINSDDLCEIIDFLYSNHIPELMDRKTDAVLPTLNRELKSTFTISEKRVPSSVLKTISDHDNYCKDFP